MDAARTARNLRRPVSLRTADYDYVLPEGLIARHPAERRDGSRMMVLHRDTQRIEHRMFADFPSFLQSGDLVVLNDTRVIPARAFSDDGRIELLFLERVAAATAPSVVSDTPPATRHSPPATMWRCLVKPGRKMRLGALVHVGGVAGV